MEQWNLHPPTHELLKAIAIGLGGSMEGRSKDDRHHATPSPRGLPPRPDTPTGPVTRSEVLMNRVLIDRDEAIGDFASVGMQPSRNGIPLLQYTRWAKPKPESDPTRN